MESFSQSSNGCPKRNQPDLLENTESQNSLNELPGQFEETALEQRPNTDDDTTDLYPTSETPPFLQADNSPFEKPNSGSTGTIPQTISGDALSNLPVISENNAAVDHEVNTQTPGSDLQANSGDPFSSFDSDSQIAAYSSSVGQTDALVSPVNVQASTEAITAGGIAT